MFFKTISFLSGYAGAEAESILLPSTGTPQCPSEEGHVILPGDHGTDAPSLGKEWTLPSSLPAQSSPAAWGEGRGRWEERSQTLIYVWGFFLACSAVLKPLVAYWIASVAPRPRCFVSSEHSSLVQSRVACCDLHSACSNTRWRETLVIFHLILSMCMHTHAYKLKYKISILSFKLMILFSLETCVGTAQ